MCGANNEPVVQARVLVTLKTQQLLGYGLINQAAPGMEVVEHSKHD